jgi:hypothetical protein
MHWIREQYTPVLSALLEQFVASKRDVRVAVVAQAAEDIKVVAQKHGYDLPDLLERVRTPSFVSVLHSFTLPIFAEN